ncbi:MAG: hypothetical protein WC680_03510 [Sulfuricurvum sp.]|jgi:hypothetical protein
MIIQIFEGLSCELKVVKDANKITKRYVLDSLIMNTKIIATSWDELVDFAEIFNAFNKNCLNNGYTYFIQDCYFKLLTNVGKPPRLNIFFYRINREGYSYDFTKYETLLVYNKLSKIVNKCDFGEL